MKKLLYLLALLLPLAGFTQNTRAFYGSSISRSYGVDTLGGYKAINLNGDGLAGFIAISGGDTAAFASDSANGLTLITGSNRFYWPRTDSTANFTLATDGNGQLYWQAQDSTNGNFDTLTVNNFYFNTSCVPTITGHSNSLLLSNSVTDEVRTTNCDTLHYLYVDTLQTGTLIGGGWALTGNAGTDPAINFVGSADTSLFIKAFDLVVLQADENGVTITNNKIGHGNSIGLSSNAFSAASGIGRIDINSFSNSNDTASIDLFLEGPSNKTRIELINEDKKIEFLSDSAFVFQTGIVSIGNSGSTLRIADGTEGVGKILTSDTDGNATWENLSSVNAASIPPYADNATAVGAIGAGKLYYTDVAGEYIVKITH